MPKKLLFSVTIKDCEVSTFTVGGAGGSGKDTSSTGVRVVHPPSGASGRAVESRSQLENKRSAFRRMAESQEFKLWHRRVTNELLSGKSIDERVKEDLDPKNLRIEGKDAKGRWMEIDLDTGITIFR